MLFCSCIFPITSLGEERANLSAFRTFVRFALVCSSSSCLGWAAACNCGTPLTFLLPFFFLNIVNINIHAQFYQYI